MELATIGHVAMPDTTVRRKREIGKRLSDLRVFFLLLLSFDLLLGAAFAVELVFVDLHRTLFPAILLAGETVFAFWTDFREHPCLLLWSHF